MSHFGVSTIRKDATTGEVKSCLVHEIEKVGNEFHTKSGIEKPFEEVASRIVLGDSFHVLIKDDGGDYMKGEKIFVKSGPAEYLFSRPNNSLFDLPLF